MIHVESEWGQNNNVLEWTLRALSMGVEQLGHEADHSLPSSVEVQNVGTIPLHDIILN
jgi:hypothetical protein